MTVCHQRIIEGMIRGMDTVAIVGNGMSALKGGRGAEIDGHRYVFRINAGVPTPDKKDQLGEKVSFLAVAKPSMFVEAWNKLSEEQRKGTKALIYCKPKGMSEIGDNGWEKMQRWAPGNLPLWRYGMDMELRVREASQTNLSTGPRLADFLWRYVRPRQITLYGFDFFGVSGPERSWYREDTGPRPHNGAKERAYIIKMGFRPLPNGTWKINS